MYPNHQCISVVRMCYNNTVSSFTTIFLDAGEIPTSQIMPCTCNVTSSGVGTYSIYSIGTDIVNNCGTRLVWNGSVPEGEQIKSCRNPTNDEFYTTDIDSELNGAFILDQTDTSITPDTKYCMELGELFACLKTI